MAGKRVVQYKGNVWIYEHSVAYRREVERVLKRMTSVSSGRALLDRVSRHGKWMMIIPFVPTKEEPVNAYATWSKDEGYSDSMPEGYIHWREIEVMPGFRVKVPGWIGTGVGTTVHIKFHPATFHELIKRSGGYIAPGTGPGEILFHEMVHGYRIQNGLLRLKDKVAGNPHMHNVEELYAIMASNVYRSERGFKVMRAHHAGFEKLGKIDANSENYYDEFKTYIDQWFASQSGFCMAMARVRTKFNPFTVAAVSLGLMEQPSVPMAL